MTSERASTIAASIRAYILSRFPLARDLNIGDDQSLLDTQLIDSLGVLDVVGFLEDTFAIQVEDDDLSPENFDSVGALVRFVLRKPVNRV